MSEPVTDLIAADRANEDMIPGTLYGVSWKYNPVIDGAAKTAEAKCSEAIGEIAQFKALIFGPVTHLHRFDQEHGPVCEGHVRLIGIRKPLKVLDDLELKDIKRLRAIVRRIHAQHDKLHPVLTDRQADQLIEEHAHNIAQRRIAEALGKTGFQL